MRAIDTNVFIFYLVEDSIFGKQASEIIRSTVKGESVLIPLAVFKETLFAMLKRGRSKLEMAEFFTSFDLENVNIAEDDFVTFLHGLRLSEEYKLGVGDGVIIATMLKHGVKEIYSNDPDFDKVPGIKRVF